MTRMLGLIIGLSAAFVLSAPFLINWWMMAQAQIITVPNPENGTKLILNMKDRTQTLVNATTNETISASKFIFRNGNETSNETIPESVGNMTSNETIPESVGNMTSNETIPESVGNMTSNINLTEKFKELG